MSMCLLSLKPEDANRTDWDEVQKEKPQYRKALLSWVKHFHDKYRLGSLPPCSSDCSHLDTL